MVLEELGETSRIEASTRDHETDETGSVDGLLALLLELEGDFVLDVLLDRLGAHSSALFLNHWKLDGLRVAKETYHEV